MSKQTLTLQEAKNDAESKWNTAVGKLGDANDAFNRAEEARREANVEAESAWLTWAKSCIDLGEEMFKRRMKSARKRKRWQRDRNLWKFMCFAVGRDPRDANYLSDGGINHDSKAWDDWKKGASEMGWLRDIDEEEYDQDTEDREWEDRYEEEVEGGYNS